VAFQAYISVKGNKQGQFKGEGIQDKRKDKWMPALSFTMGLKSPRDIATGHPSGKRQFDQVTIVKEWGAASPQGLTSCATNEVLSEVVIEFTRTNPNGESFVYQTVKLTDATIAQIVRFTGDAEGASTSRQPAGADTMALERWSFTFRKIEVDDKDGKTMFLDDWSGGA
jgi:type VI secretion system secreted protein Hcp